jgi:hypothetical protein
VYIPTSAQATPFLSLSAEQISVSTLVFSKRAMVLSLKGITTWKLVTGCIDERSALVDFKTDLTDPANLLSSWRDDDPCKWTI